jgi:hypothetical protein
LGEPGAWRANEPVDSRPLEAHAEGRHGERDEQTIEAPLAQVSGVQEEEQGREEERRTLRSMRAARNLDGSSWASPQSAASDVAQRPLHPPNIVCASYSPKLGIRQSRSRLANGLRGPLVIDVGQVVKEAVAMTEVLGDLRGELLVHGLGGLLGGRLLEGRRVHE